MKKRKRKTTKGGLTGVRHVAPALGVEHGLSVGLHQAVLHLVRLAEVARGGPGVVTDLLEEVRVGAEQTDGLGVALEDVPIETGGR
jgi:hypothetical protein